MSTDNKKSGGAPTGALVIAGILLMVGGVAFSKYVQIGFLETLAKQGLPIDLGETISTIGVLLILFPVVKMFFIVPLQDAIQERNSMLERTFAEVESLRDDMSKMKTDYETRLTATEANARDQIQNQIREAQSLRQTLTAEATERAELLLEQARVQIEQEKAKAILEMRTSVVDLTLLATEKIIGVNLDDARNRKLIDDFINAEEVAL